MYVHVQQNKNEYMGGGKKCHLRKIKSHFKNIGLFIRPSISCMHCRVFKHAHQPQLTLVTLTRCGYEVDEWRRVGAMQRGGMGEQRGPVAQPVIACVC